MERPVFTKNALFMAYRGIWEQSNTEKIEIKKGIQKYTVPSNLLKPGYKYRYKVGVLGTKDNIHYSPIKYFRTTEYPEITYPVDNYTFARTEAGVGYQYHFR